MEELTLEQIISVLNQDPDPKERYEKIDALRSMFPYLEQYTLWTRTKVLGLKLELNVAQVHAFSVIHLKVRQILEARSKQGEQG